jgi:hypothetical protein
MQARAPQWTHGDADGAADGGVSAQERQVSHVVAARLAPLVQHRHPPPLPPLRRRRRHGARAAAAPNDAAAAAAALPSRGGGLGFSDRSGLGGRARGFGHFHRFGL